MIDLSRAVNRDGLPVIPTRAPIDHLQQRRADLATSWEAAFDESRRNNRPPKYEMTSAYMEYYTTAALLMYSAFDPIDQYAPYEVMDKFLLDMEVGGYRIGRSRFGTPWASIFVRNVQYCAVKYVPRAMRYPELVLLSLVGRANLKRMSEWITETFESPIDLARFNRRNVECKMENDGRGWLIRVESMGFSHSFDVSDFLGFFVRTFDSNYPTAQPIPNTAFNRAVTGVLDVEVILPFMPRA